MNAVEISIIVPIYNAANYLETCIKSILNQTFKNFELILVDDGSKDESLEICNKIMSLDNRVKVIHQKNAGSSAAKNTGIFLAKGNYIAFCDADDTLDCDYIQNLYQGVILHKADVCVGNVAFTNMKGYEIISRRTVDMTAGIFNLKEFMGFYPQYMPNAVVGAPWNKLYKRSIILENKLCFNTKIKNNEDTHFNFDFFPKCNRIYVSESPYYNYINRYDVASASKGYIPNIFDIYLLTYRKAVDFLKITNTYNENILFQNKYFISLVIGAINGIVKGNNKLSFKEKVKEIKDICHTKEVQDAVKTIKFDSIKRNLVAKLIKFKQVRLMCLLVSLKK